MGDPAELWRCQIHAGLLTGGSQLFLQVGKIARRPEGFTQKLLDVVRNDPRFVVTGAGHTMTLSAAAAAAAPRRILAGRARTASAAAAPDPQPCGMEDLAEEWRRKIHTRLLADGALLFVHLAPLVKRPEGLSKVTHKLLDVVAGDSRFEVTGSGNTLTLSAAPPARRVPARPTAAAPADPSPSPYAQHPERLACESYIGTGICPFGEGCHFDHPPKVDAVRSGASAWGTSRAETPSAAAAGAREAAPVRRGVVCVELAARFRPWYWARLIIYDLTSCSLAFLAGIARQGGAHGLGDSGQQSQEAREAPPGSPFKGVDPLCLSLGGAPLTSN